MMVGTPVRRLFPGFRRSSRKSLGVACLVAAAFGLCGPLGSPAAAPRTRSIPIDRVWDRLTPPAERGSRATLLEAGQKLGRWGFELSLIPVDGKRLVRVARQSEEPLVRALREDLGQAVDLGDFLLFLDDLLVAGRKGLRGKRVVVPSGRARSAGILLHPQDVYRKDQPRIYGDHHDRLLITDPPEPRELEPAEDDTPLGPRWTARFRQPTDEAGLLELLGRRSPSTTFHTRVDSLVTQLREQGATVTVQATVRDRRRGYLIYGSYLLSRCKTKQDVRRRVRKLERLRLEWEIEIPIRWAHPKGWRATIHEARQMADTYDVVYATERGARDSDHYDGLAADFSAWALPRKLTLQAPSGASRSFDLSAPYHSRDLALTPELVKWIEQHFQMEKLLMDYPHWTDAAPLPEQPEGGNER